MEPLFGCSTLTAKTPEGGYIMGRNYDFLNGTGLILHTVPDNGYESIATFDTNFFGFDEGYLPEGFVNQYMALAGLFVSLDGVNEKGFAIADLVAGDTVETHQYTGKPALTTTSALRYLLNKAATVDEALELLRGIDMHSDVGCAHHFAMADAQGRSVVVEYVDNEMVVVDTPACANHYLCEAKLNAGIMPGDLRYEKMRQNYDDAAGVMSKEALTEAIKNVTQFQRPTVIGPVDTIWTMIIDLTNPSVTYYNHRNFDKPFHFKLERNNHQD